MKIRKILSLLLCVALCIVPLPFEIDADAYDEEISIMSLSEALPCGCTDGYTGLNWGYVKEIAIQTANQCYKTVYDYVVVECNSCGERTRLYDVLIHVYTQHNIQRHPTGGHYECVKCHYRIN